MAVVIKTVNGYATRTEAGLAMADSAGANVVTKSGTVTSDDLSNKKFIVQVEVTELSAGDGAYDCKIEASLDGTNFVTVDTSIGMDVDNTGLNTGVGLADLSDIYAPYYRITVFTDGTDTADAAAFTLSYAFKLPAA